MARVHFDQQLIGDLRKRVIEHNQSAPEGAPPAKLGAAKAAYQRAYERHRGKAPGVVAMAKVEAYFGDLLAKAAPFDESKHVRDGDGKFAPKGGAAPTEAQHTTRQATDPEYRATTTDALMDTRHAAVGAVVRDAGALAIGTALTASLVHQGKPGRVQRIVREAWGATGGAIARAPTLLVGRAGVAGVNAASRLAARVHGRQARQIDPAAVDRAANTAGRIGRRAGETINDGITHVKGAIGRAAMDAVTDADATTIAGRLGNRARRAGVLVGLSLPTAMLIRNTVQGSVLDPEAIGRTLDAFSHREVRKFDQVRGEMLAKVDEGPRGESLEKAARRLWSAASTYALPGLAAAAGAAVGGGAAAAGMNLAGDKPGNPYRDKDGKFTSKDKAVATVGGAVLGGAVAGVATAMALRRGNVRAFAGRVTAQVERQKATVNKILSENSTGRVAAMLGRKDTRIGELVQEVPQLRQRVEAAARFGASDTSYFVEKAREEVVERLALVLHEIPAVKLPKAVNGATTVKEMLANASPRAVNAHLKTALANVDSKTFDTMISGLDATQKGKLKRLFDLQQGAPGTIAQGMAGHTAKIAAQEAKATTARARVSKLKATLDDAQLEFDTLPDLDAGRAAAKAALDKATDAYDKAETAAAKAVDALTTLKSSPTGAFSLITGKAIPVPSPAAISANTIRVQQDARAAAERLFEQEIAGARAKQVAEAVASHNRQLAGVLQVGGGAKLVPGTMRQKARTFATRGRVFTARRAILRKAEAELATAQGVLQGLKGKRVSTQIRDEAKQEVLTATTARNIAQAKLAGAEIKMNEAGVAFVAARAAAADAAGNRAEAVSLRRASTIALLGNDLGRAANAVRAPIDNFIASPTGARLVDFARSAKDTGVGAAGTARDAFVSAFRQTYMVQDAPNGPWRMSMPKLLRNGVRSVGVFGGLVAGGGVAYSEAKDYFSADPTKPGSVNPFRKGQAFQVDDEFDPITGAGFVTISVKDPENPNERLVVWGERTPGQQAANVGGFVTGAKLSDVKRRVAEEKQRQQQAQQQAQQQRQGGAPGGVGDAKGFPEADAKNVASAIGRLAQTQKQNTVVAVDGTEGNFTWRSGQDKDPANDSAATIFRDWLSGASGFVTEAGARGGKLFSALQDGLFSKQGQILKQGQAFNLLTGFNGDGQYRGKGILPKMDDFGAGGDAAEGLDKVISNAQTAFGGQGLQDAQKQQLHRVVTLVGRQKQVSADAQKALHARIRSGTTAAAKTAAEAAPTASVPKSKLVELDEETAAFMPDQWEPAEFDTQAADYAESINRSLRMNETVGVMQAIKGVALMAASVAPGMSELEAVSVAGRAIMRASKADRGDTEVALSQADPEHFTEALDTEVARWLATQVKKGDLVDDLDGLMKAAFSQYDESKHVRDGEGQWTRKGTGQAGATGGRERRPPRAPKPHEPPPERGLTEPVRAGTELGGAMASQAVWSAVAAFLPTPARTSLKVARMGGALVGGVAAGIPGAEAGAALGERVYAARGEESPGAYEGPNYEGVGEMASDIAGATGASIAGMSVGTLVGSLLGGPVGAFAGGYVGGVAGGYLGGEAGRRVYSYFNHYGVDAGEMLDRHLAGPMRKRAPVRDTTPVNLARVDRLLSGYGAQGEQAARYFRPRVPA